MRTRLLRSCLNTGAILLAILFVQLVPASPALGQSSPADTPGRLQTPAAWTEVEKWVWQRLRKGEVADLNARDGWILDPAAADGWGKARLLSPAFIESLLMHEPWSRSLPRQGVQIVGAFFSAALDLVDSYFDHTLSLEQSRFAQPVNLAGCRAQHLVSFEGSHFLGRDGNKSGMNLTGATINGQLILRSARISGTLSLNRAVIAGNLLMGRGAAFSDIDMRGVSVGGQLILNGSRVSGNLGMSSADIGGGLFMSDSARFAEVNMRGVRIGDHIDLVGATVSGTLIMRGAEVGDSLYMSNGAKFNDIDMSNATIKGDADLEGAEISGVLVLDGAVIGNSLLLRGSRTEKLISCVSARIDRDLDLRLAKDLPNLDLSAARIRGKFILSSPGAEPTWKNDAQLILHNAIVEDLRDTRTAWPERIVLDGFIYRRLSGVQGANGVVDRGSDWFIGWLYRDNSYTPLPYSQLAGVLHQMGCKREADDVLYAGREHARATAFENGHYWTWAELLLLKYSIGYGYGSRRLFRSVLWLFGMVLIGASVLRLTGRHLVPAQHGLPQMRIGFFYSLDRLLPMIQLRKRHYDIDLSDRVRYYFYFHQITGYLIAALLIAGILGLTK